MRMRYLFCITLLVFLVCLGVSGIGSAEGTSSRWRVILNVKIAGSGLAGFRDENDGIVFGNHHTPINITKDGCKTWTQMAPFHADLWGLEIFDDQTVYCCGEQKVLASMDGGANWRRLADFGDFKPDHSRFISFADAQTGWIATPQSLGTTRDGGKTWTEMPLPKGLQEIAALDLLTPDNGYILGKDGSLLITNDAGKHWMRRSIKLTGPTPPTASTPTAAVRFTDPLHGVIVMWVKGSKFELWTFTTADGGANWSKEMLPATLGAVYLSRDGKTLTTNSTSGEIIVFRQS